MNTLPRRSLLAGLGAMPLAALATPQSRSARAEKPGATPHTRYAVNLEMWWRGLPFLERIDRAAELGFPALEFWPWRGKDLDAIAERCKKHKIEIAQFTAWGFKPGMNDPHNHDAVVAEIEASCQVALRLDVKKMCVVGGDDVPGMSQHDMHQNIIQALKRAAPIAEKHQVMLVLEPMNIRVDHKGHCLYGTEPAVRICRAVQSPFVKVLFDLYHSHVSEGDLCGHLRDGFDQLGYVQIADHPGRNEPGTGEIHYPRVLRELHALGYREAVGLELRPKQDEVEAAQACHRADQW